MRGDYKWVERRSHWFGIWFRLRDSLYYVPHVPFPGSTSQQEADKGVRRLIQEHAHARLFRITRDVEDFKP